MADHKRQHYVPRCHFKPFSIDGEGDAISLLNLTSHKAVRSAPIKGQCARNYLYGEDLVLEKLFQRIEGEYARVVRVVMTTPKNLASGDIAILRLFTAIQHFRTEQSINRTRDMHVGMANATFDGRPPSWSEYRPETPSDRQLMHMTMRVGIQSSRVFDDLKTCLIINHTNHDFITSDDPAVFTSRYYIQKVGTNNFGLGSSGAMLMLPLSPKHLILFYDGNVYTIPGKQEYAVSVDKTSDIFALNEFQYLKAARNVYFTNYSDAERIQEEYSRVEPNKPKQWFSVSTFIQDDDAPEGIERYHRPAEDEQLESQTALVAVSTRHPRPSRWFTGLQYRGKPRVYSNGSAIGYVRKQEWLTRDGFEQDTGRDH